MLNDLLHASLLGFMLGVLLMSFFVLWKAYYGGKEAEG